MATTKQPNHLLRYEREKRGLSQRKVADLLETSEEMVSRWERGERKTSPFYQEKLCQIFGKDAVALGFLDPPAFPAPDEACQAVQEEPSPTFLSSTVRTPTHALDLLLTSPGIPVEQQAGAWLTLGANSLRQLFNKGWTVENILNALEIILQGIQAIPLRFQSRLFQTGTIIGGSLSVSVEKYISEQEKIQLINALGKSIGDAWQLFHTSERNEQALTIGQAQLYILQRCHEILPPNVLPWFYSAVYRLIGAALHFQGRYYEALQSHNKAYITALESADGWNVAQCRSWQAYAWKSLGYYSEALQAIDAALRVISERRDIESIRLQARLLALGAEVAAMMGNKPEVYTRLSASEALLEYLPAPHEEFDRISWLQWAGICVLHFGQHELAIKRLQQALDELPVQWVRRYISTAIPLARAFARMKEREGTLAIAQKTLPLVISMHANAVTQEFVDYLQKDLLSNFPSDTYCQAFSNGAYEQLSLTKRGGN